MAVRHAQRPIVRAGIALLSLVVPHLAYATCTIQCVGTSCSCVSDTTDCDITEWQPPNGVPPGATIDCAIKDVHLTGGTGKITVHNGVLTLRARDLVIDGTRYVEATRDQSGVAFGMMIELTGKLDVKGFLRANSDFGGGSIQVAADGNILIGPSSGALGILARGTASGADGGCTGPRCDRVVVPV